MTFLSPNLVIKSCQGMSHEDATPQYLLKYFKQA